MRRMVRAGRPPIKFGSLERTPPLVVTGTPGTCDGRMPGNIGVGLRPGITFMTGRDSIIGGCPFCLARATVRAWTAKASCAITCGARGLRNIAGPTTCMPLAGTCGLLFLADVFESNTGVSASCIGYDCEATARPITQHEKINMMAIQRNNVRMASSLIGAALVSGCYYTARHRKLQSGTIVSEVISTSAR